MTNYERGANFERAVKKMLEDDGYFVQRTAGSRTPIDLTAHKRGELLLIQAKRDGAISPKERADLLQVKDTWFGGDALALLAFKAGPRSGVQFRHVTREGKGEPWQPDEVAS